MTVAVDILGAAKIFGDGPDAVHAFGPLDLAVEAGAFVSLLGPSGCGKSTLMLMIAGLLAGAAGEIAWPAARSPARRPTSASCSRDKTLVVARRAAATCCSSSTCAACARGLSRPRRASCCARSGSSGFADRRPYELSGGMQQRAAFCQALVHDPPLVLLDEPLGELDAMTREQLRTDLQRLWLASGTTVVFVTHSIEEAVQLADKVCVITPRPGRIEREIEIDLPCPRDLEVCETPAFHAHVAEIQRIFACYGVL